MPTVPAGSALGNFGARTALRPSVAQDTPRTLADNIIPPPFFVWPHFLGYGDDGIAIYRFAPYPPSVSVGMKKRNREALVPRPSGYLDIVTRLLPQKERAHVNLT
jgi:hypothetical protein